jgi:hypothetical protein
LFKNKNAEPDIRREIAKDDIHEKILIPMGELLELNGMKLPKDWQKLDRKQMSKYWPELSKKIIELTNYEE